MKTSTLTLVVVLLLAASMVAAAPTAPHRHRWWRPARLRNRAQWIGLWEASGGGQPGTGTLGLTGSGWLMYQPAKWRNIGCGTYVLQWVSPVSVGVGPRFTYAGSWQRTAYTAAASPPELHVVTPQHTALNLAVQVRVRLWRHRTFFPGRRVGRGTVSAGANLDLVGVGFGPARTDGATNQSAQPAWLNLALGRRGTTTTELFLAIKTGRQLSLRAGLARTATAYEVPDRTYQRSTMWPFIGVSYVPGRYSAAFY